MKQTEEAIAAAQAKMDAEFRARPVATAEDLLAMTKDADRAKIKVCDVCRGMRVLQTEYNNRIMERMCDRCDGEGVLSDGKPIGPPSGAPPDPPPNPDPFKPGEGSKVRVAVLTRDIGRLEKQMKKYHDELRAAMERLEGDDTGASHEQALSEFVHQVQQQLGRLQDKRDDKRKELAALKGRGEDDDAEAMADELP